MKFSDDQRAKIGGQASWPYSVPYSIPFFPQEVKMPRTHTLPLLLLALFVCNPCIEIAIAIEVTESDSCAGRVAESQAAVCKVA